MKGRNIVVLRDNLGSGFLGLAHHCKSTAVDPGADSFYISESRISLIDFMGNSMKNLDVFFFN